MALTPQQLGALTKTQSSMLDRGVGRLIKKHGAAKVTPEMVMGQYKLVTEYHLPNGLETLLNLPDERLSALADKDK